MAPIPNPRVLFNDIPEGGYRCLITVRFDTEYTQGFPEPGKTTVYDESQTIDLETLPVPDGAFVVKTLYVAIDPYMRGQMRQAEVESYSVS